MTDQRADSGSVDAACSARFPAPPLMAWTPPPCSKRAGHTGPHRSFVWLYTPPEFAEQRKLTCSWTDTGRPAGDS